MTNALLSEVGRGEVRMQTTIVRVPLSPEEVGQRIVRAREEMTPKPWSQFDLALAVGVSPSTIYRWEKGRLPSMNDLMRVAEVLRKPAEYLTEPPEHQLELRDLQNRLEALEGSVAELLALTRESHELLREEQLRISETRPAQPRARKAR